MDVPVIDTPRLRLRAFEQADLDRYAAMCADAEVMRHIGEGGAVGRDVAWRQMAAFLGHWALRGYGMWAIERRDDGTLIGRAGFLHPEGWPGLEVGWLLERAAWGQGLAFEAARAAIDWGRRERGMGELISLIRDGNTRSEALALRLGARHDGDVELMGAPAQRFRYDAGV